MNNQYRKKPVVIEATQWFKNGDHPRDYSLNPHPEAGEIDPAQARMADYEGAVVRRFRRPDVDGGSNCQHCGGLMHIHGWIDTLEGGHIVCPGDWIITGVAGENYPCKPAIFAATYEPAIAPPVAEAIPAQAFDFHAHLARQAAFSLKTFGPGRRTVGVCDHIRKELLEIAAKPDDLSEWIDVVILALDGAWRCGGSPEQIIGGIVAKQTKNEGRVWPDWRTADPDKAIEHDRSHDAEPEIPAQTGIGASIDTPEDASELQRLAEYWRGEPYGTRSFENAWAELVAYINAYGRDQYQSGLAHAIQTIKNSNDTAKEALRQRDELRERAEKSEAALAAIDVARNAGGNDLLAGRAAMADGRAACSGDPTCCSENEGYGCACSPQHAVPLDINASTVTLSQARREIARLRAELVGVRSTLQTCQVKYESADAERRALVTPDFDGSPCGQCGEKGVHLCRESACVPAKPVTNRSPMAQVSDLACAARDLAAKYGMVLTVYQAPRMVGEGQETVVSVRVQ